MNVCVVSFNLPEKKWKGELNGKCVSIDATELVGAGTPVTVCHGTDCFTADAS